MQDLILPFRGGNVVITAENYSCFEIHIDNRIIMFGHEDRISMIKNIFKRLNEFIENGKEYQGLIWSLEPHCEILISRSMRTMLFCPYNYKFNKLYEVSKLNGIIPDDFEQSTFIIELSDADYKIWTDELTDELIKCRIKTSLEKCAEKDLLMPELILPFRGGNVVLTDEEYSCFEIHIGTFVMKFGSDMQYLMYKTLLKNLTTKLESASVFIVNGNEYQLLCVLCPHCDIYVSLSAKKMLFYPYNYKLNKLYEVSKLNGIISDDFEQSTFIIELSDADYKIWTDELTNAMNLLKNKLL